MATIFRERTATREDCAAVAEKLYKLCETSKWAATLTDSEIGRMTDARVNAVLDTLDLLEIPYEPILGTHNEIVGWNVNGQIHIGATA